MTRQDKPCHQYAIPLQKETPGGVADIPPEVMEANLRAGEQFAAMGAKVVHEQALQPSAATRTIHKTGLVTDGPFAETKEALGGFYLIEARDLDQALAIGKLCPAMAAASRSGRS